MHVQKQKKKNDVAALAEPRSSGRCGLHFDGADLKSLSVVQ